MRTALLISTYNWPEALEVVLKSVKRQVQLPDEILIADDGSGKETQNIIEQFQNSLSIPIKHFWQEDKGFRKSEILNKAIAQTNVDYIIQIDGDCIVHPFFVQDHRNTAQEGSYVFGSRVNIKPSAVPGIYKNKHTHFSVLSPSIKNRTRNFHIPILQKIYTPKPTFSTKTRGCNLAYWRKDFIGVNGYDEAMEGWGREDTEFVWRMVNKGIYGKRLRYGGIVYHIFHPENSRNNLDKNDKIQKATEREKRTWCNDGIDKYLRA
ncbi:glycosyltransferase family 2 protein [Antarcticibacterium sp. 1MA-6-2]|uniref:glycosyltransferase family 2 protein n=1 Tax=Antarcticibacterium sp. 1MA-6-2 TaxID=2908210 RepID=UPI001F17F890|nr:glycosyltransferase family 2 protein [Antarcticibacterium sp. 1MA-6-2]UJH92198.1 glycosyltransferase family 2 protein [Antarcticibacterium sp. 1MA-6-2]